MAGFVILAATALTGETVAAFFIALSIQTAGNPDGLRLVMRDCQLAHPLDEHRIIVEWAKPRAGGKVKRAQSRSLTVVAAMRRRT